MSLKSFLQDVLGIKKGETKGTMSEDFTITNNQQQTDIINRNQQKVTSREDYNIRDLQYARRVGQLEEMSADISDIKEKITGLDIKFDLRVPDKVLSEEKFRKEVAESDAVFQELEKIKQSLNELRLAITSGQQLPPIATTTLERIRVSTEKIEENLRESEIIRYLKPERLTTEELGKKISLSRSRTNQILLEMQQRGLVSRIKYGKKYIWIAKQLT